MERKRDTRSKRKDTIVELDFFFLLLFPTTFFQRARKRVDGDNAFETGGDMG